MSKRLTRIFAPILPHSISGLLQQQVHVVLRSGHTVFGYLESSDNVVLIIKDLRDHIHKIEAIGVEEIILDRQGTSPVSYE